MKGFYFILGLVFLSGCPVYDPPTGSLAINNKTDSPVYIYLTCSDSLPLDPPLKVYFPKAVTSNNTITESKPETPFQKLKLELQKLHTVQDSILANAIDYHPYYRIKAKSVGSIAVGGSPEKPQIVCESDQINIFFIKESTLQHNTWEVMCKKKLYEQLKTLDSEKLESANWEVVYPVKQ